MDISKAMEVLQGAMVVALKLAAPVLAVSIVLGLVIAIFQAATQIHEQTLTFVPKLVGIAAVLVILGAWMMQVMSDFTLDIFSMIANLS